MPWPSYPLYPLMARARRCHAGVASRVRTCLLRDHRRTTRALALCATRTTRPGTYIALRGPRRAAVRAARSTCHVLLDEALIHFQDVEDIDACLRLVDAFPRLLVVRTFSKIYGLSGLRAGYAVGSRRPAAARRPAPVLGVNALHAGGRGARPAPRRRRGRSPPSRKWRRERQFLTDELRALGADVTDSQANFLWIRVRDLNGDELANALRKQGVIVAPGGPLGEDHHIRAAVRNEQASRRLLRAVENLL